MNAPRFMGRFDLIRWLIPVLALTKSTLFPASALARQSAPETEEQVLDTIVVEGERVRGKALSDIEPELVLTEEDIAAYGAGSLGELIELISADISSNRGRSSGPPVVLINGRRVSGFREVGRYPVEALARVEVLPEEVSLSYGFAANQRVLNFVLKPDITVTTLTSRIASPQQGDQVTVEGTAQRLYVNGAERVSLDGEFKRSDRILEANRGIVFVAGPELAEFRTLLPETLDWNLGGTAGREVWGGVIATLSGSYVSTRAENLLGLGPSDVELLSQVRNTEDIFSGLSIASALAPTTWTFTANFNQITVDTLTDLPASTPTTQQARLRRRSGSVDFVLNQRLADLEAGPLALTASLGWRGEEQDTLIETIGELIENSTARNIISGKVSLNAPISLPRPLPGEITLNGNADLRYLSDFNLLTTLGAGVTWRPTEQLRLLLSFSDEDGAPALEDLGAPQIATPNARIFDFQTGTDVFATLISGGNPDLIIDGRRVYKLGLQWTPQDTPRLQLNIDYTRSRIENEVRTFRLLTGAFETAFPDRVMRDVSSELLSFDRTPVQVNLARRDAVRTILSFSKRLKASRVRRRGPPPRKRRRSGRPGSLRISAVHNWTLRDEVEISDNAPLFDFLGGASGTGLGGTPAHIVDLSVNRWNNGFGLSVTGRYQGGTSVDTPEGKLSFSDLFLANIRLTYEFNYNDRVLNIAPFLEETRVSFSIDNVLDQRLQVTDEMDATPLNFQEDILDPLGQTFRFEVRRRF